MSTFKVKNATNGTNETVVASAVARVVDNGTSGAIIVFKDGLAVPVSDSYRSVRGYLNKALGGNDSE